MSISFNELKSLESGPILERKRARSQPSTYSDEHVEIDQEQDFVPPKTIKTSGYHLTPAAKHEVEWFKWLASDCKKPIPAGDMPDWVKNHLENPPQEQEMKGLKRKSENSEYSEAEDEKKQLIVKLKLPKYILEKLGVVKTIFGGKEAMEEKRTVEGGLEPPSEETKTETGDSNKSETQEGAESGGVSVTNGVDDLDERETRLEKVRSEIAAKRIKLQEIRAGKAAKKAAKQARREAKKRSKDNAAI